MVSIAAFLNKYGLVISLPSIVLSDDKGFNVCFKMWSMFWGSRMSWQK